MTGELAFKTKKKKERKERNQWMKKERPFKK